MSTEKAQNLFNAYLDSSVSFWKGSFKFKGKTSRMYFWLSMGKIIFLLLILFGCVYLYNSLGAPVSSKNIRTITVLNILIISCLILGFLPFLAMQMRRLQDAGFNFIISLIIVLFGLIIPIVLKNSTFSTIFGLFLLILYFLPSQTK